MSLPQRFAVGGLGLVLLGMGAILLNPGERLSAMERMAKHLRKVRSYTYRETWESTWFEDGGKQRITSKGDGSAAWRAPAAFRNQMKIVKTEQVVQGGATNEQVIEHFAEIFPADRPGIFVDYVRRTIDRVPFEPTGSRTYPQDMLRKIQEGAGRVTRELGTKEIDGKPVRGYVIVLDAGARSAPRTACAIRSKCGSIRRLICRWNSAIKA